MYPAIMLFCLKSWIATFFFSHHSWKTAKSLVEIQDTKILTLTNLTNTHPMLLSTDWPTIRLACLFLPAQRVFTPLGHPHPPLCNWKATHCKYSLKSIFYPEFQVKQFFPSLLVLQLSVYSSIARNSNTHVSISFSYTLLPSLSLHSQHIVSK